MESRRIMERMKSEKGFIKKIRQLESKIVNSVKLMNIKYQRCDPLIFVYILIAVKQDGF